MGASANSSVGYARGMCVKPLILGLKNYILGGDLGNLAAVLPSPCRNYTGTNLPKSALRLGFASLDIGIY